MIRKNFLAATGTLVAVSGVSASAAVPGGTDLVERHANFDEAAFEKLVGKRAAIKQLFEAVSFHSQFLNNVKNTLNGLQFGFGYSPDEIAVAVCPHGPSSVYIYDETIWEKYRLGEALDILDASGQRIASNQFLKAPPNIALSDDPNDANGYYQDTSLETLQKRGVVFLGCHTAIEEQARMLARRGFAPTSTSATDVASEILSSLVAGVIVVPSMVATVAVLQRRYGYAYTTLTL